MATTKKTKAEARQSGRRTIKEMREIASDVRSRREKHGVSQAVVASWLGISQRKYCYFEAARAELTEQQIEQAVLRFDGLDRGEHLGAIYGPLNLLTEAELLDIQQRKVAGGGFVDIWLFGPKSLPVLTQATYQQAWAQNLARGTNYNIVWCLDEEMDGALLRLFAKTVSDVVRVLNSTLANHGKIKLFAISVGPPDNTNNYHSFTESQKHLKEVFPEWIDIFDAHDMSEVRFKNCRSILYYGWMRSVVCYANATGTDYFAAVLLENVSNDLGGNGESGWTFLTSSAASTLLDHIRIFQRAINEPPDSP